MRELCILVGLPVKAAWGRVATQLDGLQILYNWSLQGGMNEYISGKIVELFSFYLNTISIGKAGSSLSLSIWSSLSSKSPSSSSSSSSPCFPPDDHHHQNRHKLDWVWKQPACPFSLAVYKTQMMTMMMTTISVPVIIITKINESDACPFLLTVFKYWFAYYHHHHTHHHHNHHHHHHHYQHFHNSIILLLLLFGDHHSSETRRYAWTNRRGVPLITIASGDQMHRDVGRTRQCAQTTTVFDRVWSFHAEEPSKSLCNIILKEPDNADDQTEGEGILKTCPPWLGWLFR